MPNVSLRSVAASSLSLTVVPSRVAVLAVVASGLSVRPSRKKSGASSAATLPSTETVPVSTDLPGSMTKSVSSTVLPPPVRLRPLPSWSSSPCTNGATLPGS